MSSPHNTPFEAHHALHVIATSNACSHCACGLVGGQFVREDPPTPCHSLHNLLPKPLMCEECVMINDPCCEQSVDVIVEYCHGRMLTATPEQKSQRINHHGC